jgi:hypothetical protein
MNSSTIYLIYCKNFCKCHNVPLLSTAIKEKQKQKTPNKQKNEMWNWLSKVESQSHIISSIELHLSSQIASSITNGTLLHVWSVQNFFAILNIFPYCSMSINHSLQCNFKRSPNSEKKGSDGTSQKPWILTPFIASMWWPYSWNPYDKKGHWNINLYSFYLLQWLLSTLRPFPIPAKISHPYF